jgi:hypothetical protein
MVISAVKLLVSILAIAIAYAVCLPVGAQAAFGINNFDVTFTGPDGTSATQAGSHPFAFTASLGANFNGEETEGQLEDLFFEQFPGLIGDTTSYPRCRISEFLELNEGVNACPLETAVGISANTFSEPGSWITAPVFNLSPPPGVLLRLGFRIADTTNIVVDVGLSPYPPYGPVAVVHSPLQPEDVFGAKVQLWGHPADPAHDGLRGACGVYTATLAPGDIAGFEFENKSGKSCPVGPGHKPFLTLPTSCDEPILSFYEAFSWEGDMDFGSVLTHDLEGHPRALTGCAKLGFSPAMAAAPTTKESQSPTGLDFSLDVHDEGLTSIAGIAESQIRDVVLALPMGVTASHAVVEGLAVCSEGELEQEGLEAAPGEGCPAGSQVGTVEVESPLIEESVMGAVYQATPYKNFAGDLPLAFYIVFKSHDLGIVIEQVVAVDRTPKPVSWSPSLKKSPSCRSATSA